MTIDERALPERLMWPTIPVGAGEVFDIHDPDQAARLSYYCRVVKAHLDRLQGLADEVLRDTLKSSGQRRTQLGDVEVSIGVGSPSYDADGIREALHAGETGLTEAAIEGLFEVEWKVKDGKELNALGNRNDVVQKIVVAHTKRAKGSMKLSRKKGHVDSAAIPEAVHREVMDQARVEREAEEEADALGI